jgi:hypothetical protein
MDLQVDTNVLKEHVVFIFRAKGAVLSYRVLRTMGIIGHMLRRSYITIYSATQRYRIALF